MVLEPHLSLWTTPSAARSPRKLETSTTKVANRVDIATAVPLLPKLGAEQKVP